jgi:transcriptional regulator with XRE-family HTH domain
MNIGGALKDVRQNVARRRQYEVAAAVGISQTYLSLVEGGARSPTTDVIEKLCLEYRVPIAFVFWKAMEPKDVHRSKQKALSLIKPIVDDLIEGFLVNNYKANSDS